MNCSIAQCLEVVGDWWSLLIVRDALLGVTRFDEFQARLGIARNILTQRLETLLIHGVLEQVPYQQRPVRYDYRLTEKGRDLWHVATALRQWGDRWAAPAGPPVELVHRGCGRVMTVIPVCSECGEALEVTSLRPVPGPAADDPDFIPRGD